MSVNDKGDGILRSKKPIFTVQRIEADPDGTQACTGRWGGQSYTLSIPSGLRIEIGDTIDFQWFNDVAADRLTWIISGVERYVESHPHTNQEDRPTRPCGSTGSGTST